MNTNLFGLINLTETLLPKLSSDGKVEISRFSDYSDFVHAGQNENPAPEHP